MKKKKKKSRLQKFVHEVKEFFEIWWRLLTRTDVPEEAKFHAWSLLLSVVALIASIITLLSTC